MKKTKKQDKTLRFLILILIFVAVLLLVSMCLYFRPKILGSPGEDESAYDNFLLYLLIILGLTFVGLIVLIVRRYAKIRKQQPQDQEQQFQQENF